MEGELIIGLVAVVGCILIPSLAIAVRLSLKPMVDSVLRLREALGKTAAAGPTDAEAADILARLNRLETDVRELQESSTFYRELQATGRFAAVLPAGSSAAHSVAAPPDPPSGQR